MFGKIYVCGMFGSCLVQTYKFFTLFGPNIVRAMFGQTRFMFGEWDITLFNKIKEFILWYLAHADDLVFSIPLENLAETLIEVKI